MTHIFETKCNYSSVMEYHHDFCYGLSKNSLHGYLLPCKEFLDRPGHNKNIYIACSAAKLSAM